MLDLFSGRRLSLPRLAVVMAGLGLVAAATAFSWRSYTDSRAATGRSWFAAYVDVTAEPRYEFVSPTVPSTRDVVLSFIVAGSSNRCAPTWGNAYTLDQAAATLDLDRRLERLRQQSGSAIVSFGGQRNDELAVACTDVPRLRDAYRAVVERYEISTIDLDLEGAGLEDGAAGQRRALALAQLQRERREDGRPLAIWVTLPVATGGLTESGTSAIEQLLRAGVRLAGVNVMTMNFGESRDRQQSMADASEAALTATHRQMMVLYERAGLKVGPATAWRRLGATPMLGQNDVATERFSLADAQRLNAFARERGLGRMSMWSLGRDRPCGENYPDVRIVSPSCSGLGHPPLAFAKALGRGMTGLPDEGGDAPSAKESSTTPTTAVADDPSTSPYPIWQQGAAYLAGTKIVWKRNVYAAKWWTRGDQPDAPVLQDYETPWKLIGPVLSGERPVKVAKLPAGAYPMWRTGRVYRRGDRVMLEGQGFEAKWWTQGDSPFGQTSDPSGGPWAPLTEEQITAVIQARR